MNDIILLYLEVALKLLIRHRRFLRNVEIIKKWLYQVKEKSRDIEMHFS